MNIESAPSAQEQLDSSDKESLPQRREVKDAADKFVWERILRKLDCVTDAEYREAMCIWAHYNPDEPGKFNPSYKLMAAESNHATTDVAKRVVKKLIDLDMLVAPKVGRKRIFQSLCIPAKLEHLASQKTHAVINKPRRRIGKRSQYGVSGHPIGDYEYGFPEHPIEQDLTDNRVSQNTPNRVSQDTPNRYINTIDSRERNGALNRPSSIELEKEPIDWMGGADAPHQDCEPIPFTEGEEPIEEAISSCGSPEFGFAPPLVTQAGLGDDDAVDPPNGASRTRNWCESARRKRRCLKR